MIRACAWLSLGASVLFLGTFAMAQNASLGLQSKHSSAIGGGDRNAGRMVVIGGLYGEQRIACVQCHGLDGAGNSSGAFPRLADQSAWYLYKTLHDYAAGLRPSDIMGPIARSLSDRQMQNVAAYYASVRDAPSYSDVTVDVSKRQIGGAIAAIGVPSQGVPACNGCHGADGRGAPPIYPFLAGQFAQYTRLQLMLWKNGQRSGDPMNIMELIAKAMTQEQIDAVALYYASVKPKDPKAATNTHQQAKSEDPAATGPSTAGSRALSTQTTQPAQPATPTKPNLESTR